MNNQASIQKLGELIKDIKMAMLATVDDDGSIRSRPMATQQVEFDGYLWFFTDARSAKTDEVRKEHQVNIVYAAPDKNRYVSVSGTAALVRDEKKKKELWNPIYKAFFPEGVDDPNVTLLKVEVEKAEFWDSPSSAVVQTIGFVKALATGQRYQAGPGEHEKVDLKN